ncbi:unnamed protein product [Prunus armeniaca]
MSSSLPSSYPDPSPPPLLPMVVGSCRKVTSFTHNLKELVRVIPATTFFELVSKQWEFWPVSASDSGHFCRLFGGRSKNKNCSSACDLPNLKVLAGGLEFFRPPKISLGTHALPVRGVARQSAILF